MINPNIKTSKEAADYLNLSHRTLNKWRSEKTTNLPYFRVGKSIRYSKADLDAYIAGHTVNKLEV